MCQRIKGEAPLVLGASAVIDRLNELDRRLAEKEAENAALKTEVENLRVDDPSRCDVDGCYDQTSSAGVYWREAGYWRLCTRHSRAAREQMATPPMKESAVERESARDQDGILNLEKEISEISFDLKAYQTEVDFDELRQTRYLGGFPTKADAIAEAQTLLGEYAVVKVSSSDDEEILILRAAPEQL